MIDSSNTLDEATNERRRGYKSISFECDSASPVAILLARLDLEVSGYLVICDDPILFQMLLVDVMIP
jgi:hypothetical protein